MKFGLIGDGYIAQRHRKAIETLGGQIAKIYDPIKYKEICHNYSDESEKHLFQKPFHDGYPLDRPYELNESFFDDLDYVVLCSPSNLHREQIKSALHHNVKIICEKPYVLPWEPIIDDDRINIVLQLRWLDDLPEKADLVKIVAARGKQYFESWKGQAINTGGIFYNIFIHYIDLALRLGAKFEGKIIPEGRQERWVDDKSLMIMDMDKAYLNMYNDIVLNNNGVKPKDLFYLHWILNKSSDFYGYGLNAIDKTITVNTDLQ
jgi:predicted dehydrogenase